MQPRFNTPIKLQQTSVINQLNPPIILDDIVAPRTSSRFHRKTAMCLGNAQICIGLVSVGINLCSIVVPILRYPLFFLGHGIWCGFFYMIAGATGVVAARTRNNCRVILFMVMSIVSVSLFAPYHMIVTAVDISIGPQTNSNKEVKNMQILMLVMSLLELVVGVKSAVACCHSVCCRNTDKYVWPNGEVLHVSRHIPLHGGEDKSPHVAYLDRTTQHSDVVFVHTPFTGPASVHNKPVRKMYGTPPPYIQNSTCPKDSTVNKTAIKHWITYG